MQTSSGGKSLFQINYEGWVWWQTSCEIKMGQMAKGFEINKEMWVRWEKDLR